MQKLELQSIHGHVNRIKCINVSLFWLSLHLSEYLIFITNLAPSCWDSTIQNFHIRRIKKMKTGSIQNKPHEQWYWDQQGRKNNGQSAETTNFPWPFPYITSIFKNTITWSYFRLLETTQFDMIYEMSRKYSVTF